MNSVEATTWYAKHAKLRYANHVVRCADLEVQCIPGEGFAENLVDQYKPRISIVGFNPHRVRVVVDKVLEIQRDDGKLRSLAEC